MKNLLILTFVVSGLFVASSVAEAGQSDESPKAKADKKEDSTVKKEAGADPEMAARATATLKSAREKLIDHKSVRAQIVETLTIDNRRFRATGNYLQGTDLRLRLDYKIKVGSTEGSLLQVCDGEILWTRQKVGKLSAVSRRNVREILNAAASSENIPHNLLVAELGLGGLPALLASLERTMDFDTQKSETIDGNKFTVIEGKWKEKFAQHWARGNEDQSGQIPPFVPDRVRIFLDNENLFPHRILYLKQPPSKKIFRPMVVLDLTKVVLNGPINANDFSYVAEPGVQERDITQFYLRQLTASKTPSKTGPEATSQKSEGKQSNPKKSPKADN